MSDNPQADREQPTAEEFRLPGHAVLAITGRDAIAFAQAQFMNDVAALADGQWQWNGWLTPKGRVVALFALLRLDAETLWLVLPDMDARDFAAKLQRYVFRSKLTLAPRELACVGSFEAPRQAGGAGFAALEDGWVELDMSADDAARCLRIGGVPARDDPDGLARWDASDLAHGLPRLRGEQIEQWTPQQLSLERLRAFSVKKGCYPGQEIVARTHFLGQAKRGLALFEADAPLESGADVRAGDRAIGSVVTTAGRLALAVLPLERAEAALRVHDVSLHERPLLEGLAR